MTCMMLTLATVICADTTYALENAALRIEVEPRLFAVRFVGFKGKENFVAPLPVIEAEAANATWVDAGGLQTDVLPFAGKDAAVRRGPAEIVEQRDDYIAMLGPPSEVSGVRLKKEIQLDADAPRAHFRVTAQRVATEPGNCAIRNTIRLPEKNTVRLERTDGDVRVLAGSDVPYTGVVKSRRYWLIPVPPTKDLRGVVLGADATQMIVANDSGTWTRKIVEPPADKTKVPNASSFLCLLDSRTNSYGAALQGATSEIKNGEFITFEEEWTFEKRGK
ncbi:MAG: hypothetical protein IT366_13845 [Candidatus Hydrogenedentes bacterium]|nr:hypothetical protein [Candidatus Hydrogenedentota bacterium]